MSEKALLCLRLLREAMQCARTERVWHGMQVGDQLDRGDHELEILYFLERLQREAARAGGALHVLNGNHEVGPVGFWPYRISCACWLAGQPRCFGSRAQS